MSVYREGEGSAYSVILHMNHKGHIDMGTRPDGSRIDADRYDWAGLKWPLYPRMLHSPRANMHWLGSLITLKTDGTGLVYMRNRYYDPLSGQFTQEDPIGLAGGLNLYGYAGGSEPHRVHRRPGYSSGAISCSSALWRQYGSSCSTAGVRIGAMRIDRAGLERICARHDVARLRVLGSAARGEDPPESDVDVLVEFASPRSMLDLIGLQQELADFLGREADLLTPVSLSPYMRDRILAEARVLYERRAACEPCLPTAHSG